MGSEVVRLRATGLHKRYGTIQAVRNVSITLYSGKVHALVGSNGAGKSTLVKILTGAVLPDAGVLELNGQPLPMGNTGAALHAGIACIYQQSNLIPDLSVADNIVLGRHPTRAFGVLNRRAQRQQVQALLDRHQLDLDLDVPAGALSSVQKKEVEIARALSLDASVILMDEPTAALSQSEVSKLLDTIHQLCQRGVAILYISHLLDEIFAIAHDVTVLRDGEVKLHASMTGLARTTLVDAMLGQELTMETQRTVVHDLAARPIALECRHLSRNNVFYDINLQIYEGEIVCITGLIGAKRTELVRAIFGAETATGGEIYVGGKLVKIRHPVDAIRLGIGFVPEDRQQDGLFMNQSIRVNMGMAFLQRFSRAGMLLSRPLKALTTTWIQKLEIVPPLPNYPVKNLSGGNQQKVQLGRWLAGAVRILILDEPTTGIDVGTKARIYQLVRELAEAGTTVIIVSSDMEEVMAVADRIVVMANGQITGTFARQSVSQQQILAAASGETA